MNREILNTPTEEIIDNYADMVYRIALNQTKNKDNAQDVFQEVFLRLVKYKNRIQDEEHLKAWLIRVTINCSHKIHSNSFNQKVTYFEENEIESITDTQTESDYQKIEEKDSELNMAIKNLPDIYRLVIYLFYYEEMSIKEMAVITEEKETTIKSKLCRARAILKRNLEGGKHEFKSQ